MGANLIAKELVTYAAEGLEAIAFAWVLLLQAWRRSCVVTRVGGARAAAAGRNVTASRWRNDARVRGGGRRRNVRVRDGGRVGGERRDWARGGQYAGSD